MPRFRRAFTILELMVVSAIIAIMVSMLLPAIQMAQEAARRTSCRNNMIQIAVALSNYEAVHRVFPPGTVDLRGPVSSSPQGYHFSWLLQILPFMEQAGLAQVVDYSKSIYDKANDRVRTVPMIAYQCPSDATPGGVAASSYAGCHHDVEAPISDDNHGIFFLNSSVRSQNIRDGLSNTILFGERRIQPGDLPWPSGTRATLRNTGTPVNGRFVPPAYAVNLHVGGFSSNHPGGANFVFGDGAVRYISDNVDMKVYRLMGHRSDGELMHTNPF